MTDEASAASTPFEPIRLTYRLTSRDLKEAQSVLIPPSNSTKPKKPGPPPASFGQGLLGWVLFIGLVVLLFYLLNQRQPGIERESIFEQIPPERRVPVALMLGGIGMFTFGLIAFTCAQRGLRSQADFRIHDAGIDAFSPGVEEQYDWPAFHTVAETDKILIVRFGPSYGLVFPKRHFAPHQLLAFRELLNRHVTVAVPTLHNGFEVVRR